MKLKKLGVAASTLLLSGTLLLPPMTAHAGAAYTARDSDTFWKLSKTFDIPLQQLMSANPGVVPENIYAGLSLVLPNGGSEEKAAEIAAKLNPGAYKMMAAAAPAADAKSVMTASGKSLSYAKVVDIQATAYSDAPEENGWGPVDYFGNPLKLGTIAVDPKVIAFGTRVYITGYDFNGLPTGGMFATALDAGSAIKGKRIDIFVPGSPGFVSKFGIQNVKVYILD